jgi:hypothetical protein
MNKRIGRFVGAAIAIVGSLASLALFAVIGIRAGDRLIYHVHLEPLSRAEKRCDGLVPPGLADSSGRWKCLRAELVKIKESPWKGTLPLWLGVALTSLLTLGGVAVAVAGGRIDHRPQDVARTLH